MSIRHYTFGSLTRFFFIFVRVNQRFSGQFLSFLSNFARWFVRFIFDLQFLFSFPLLVRFISVKIIFNGFYMIYSCIFSPDFCVFFTRLPIFCSSAIFLLLLRVFHQLLDFDWNVHAVLTLLKQCQRHPMTHKHKNTTTTNCSYPLPISARSMSQMSVKWSCASRWLYEREQQHKKTFNLCGIVQRNSTTCRVKSKKKLYKKKNSRQQRNVTQRQTEREREKKSAFKTNW